MSQNNPLPRRKPFQIYVPIHRRNNTQSESASPTRPIDSISTTTINANTTSSQDDGLVRRGRGRFRAPSSSPTSGHSSVQSPCISNDDEQQQQHSIVDDSKSSSSHSNQQSVSNHPMSNGSPTTPTKSTITDENLATAMEKSLSLESKEDWEQLDDELEEEDDNNEHPSTAGKSKGK